ncbi:MAG: hypothetical protein HY455_01565 [Parcubacteria group bacterium]|nr:hypothetical protein [Parcubacteria group bacterium]
MNKPATTEPFVEKVVIPLDGKPYKVVGKVTVVLDGKTYEKEIGDWEQSLYDLRRAARNGKDVADALLWLAFAGSELARHAPGAISLDTIGWERPAEEVLGPNPPR